VFALLGPYQWLLPAGTPAAALPGALAGLGLPALLGFACTPPGIDRSPSLH